MLFSNTLLLAITTALVSAESSWEVNLPDGWVKVQQPQQSNKVLNRLFRRNGQASQTDNTGAPAPPKPTTSSTAPATTSVATTTLSTTSAVPSTTTVHSCTEENCDIETTTEYVASTCFDNGVCSTTTFYVAYQPSV